LTFPVSEWSTPGQDQLAALFSFWRGALSQHRAPGAHPELLFWDSTAVVWRFLQLEVCISLWEVSLTGEGLEIILVYLSLGIQ